MVESAVSGTQPSHLGARTRKMVPLLLDVALHVEQVHLSRVIDLADGDVADGALQQRDHLSR